jgi:predicted secreted protein
MATAAIAATGIVLTVDGVTIPEVTNVSGLGGQATLVDVTAHDSASAWSSKISTFLEGTPIQVQANYVPGNAAHQGLYTLFVARTSEACTVQLPDTGTTTWAFNARVTSFRIPTMPVNGVLPLEFTLEPDGALTFS